MTEAGSSSTSAMRLPRVTIVVARARNGVIGHDNAMPWHLPEDLGHFKRLTIGHPIIMGRRTHESIGRPLPGRRNLVVSRTPGYAPEEVEVVGSLDEALVRCADAPEAFVIGGAQLYRAAWSQAHRAVITEIDADFEGDASIDAPNAAQWQVTHRVDAVGAGGLRYAIVTYERRVDPGPANT